MTESDLIGLYITFPDKKGRLIANDADRKTVMDLPEDVLSQIGQIIIKSLSEKNTKDNTNNGQDKGNGVNEDKEGKGNHDNSNQ